MHFRKLILLDVGCICWYVRDRELVVPGVTSGHGTESALKQFEVRTLRMTQVYNGSRSSGESPDMWMSRHEGLWELVMPKGEVLKVSALTEEQSLSDASDSLKALVNSSLLGARLFAFAIQDIP
eukprot:1725755-Amphidinium_carterae.1